MPKIQASVKSIAGFRVDFQECPFREFKDSELSPDFWGMGPTIFRAAIVKDKGVVKHSADGPWVDDQIQPLPRSVRHYLHTYVRAEELALVRFDADTAIFDDKDGGKMSAGDYMLSHIQVLQRSSFCRKVLASCFILESMEGIIVEHQWDSFVFSFGTEGWRAKFHIYSPGMKSGGSQQHRPGLSKNGCYLVRLFYLGCWRCVWVNDLVPVDAAGAPLLPFSLLVPAVKIAPSRAVKQPMTITTKTVQLWPLLLCKALLKIAAPDMNADEDLGENGNASQDENMTDFSIIHALTGSLRIIYEVIDKDIEEIWDLLKREVVAFAWDEEEVIGKNKTTKKTGTKETNTLRKKSMASILIMDTEKEQPYILPGITPCHEMNMIVYTIRDLPLKKPPPEPDVPLWKTYRWVDWVRSHGLYKAYECPRTKYIKCSGLLKCSYSPQMLDVRSTDSIIAVKDTEKTKKATRTPPTSEVNEQFKDEFRDWVSFEATYKFIKNINVDYFPSMFQYASASNFFQSHPNKTSTNKSVNILAPKSNPLYLQIDYPTSFSVKISLNVCNPRVLHNSGVPFLGTVKPGTLLLEKFNWFEDRKLPDARAFLQTLGYDSVEIDLPAGRHFFRLWVNSRLNWHTMVVTEANLLMGTQDVIQASAARDCMWSSKYLFGLSTAFNNWIRAPKSITQFQNYEKEFYRSYSPDLPWVKEKVGYPKAFIHWMFRQALQSLLSKRLSPVEYKQASVFLRKMFYDPYFGFSERPTVLNLINIVANDPCDCVATNTTENDSPKSDLQEEAISFLLQAPKFPNVSQLCELSSAGKTCEELRMQRDKAITLNEAAMIIQSNWRMCWVKKCLESNQTFSTELLKAVLDSAFNTYEALSALMNELFTLFPGVRSAYSVASGLGGSLDFKQYTGTAVVSPTCIWIPLFQCVFYCHHPTNVNFDLRSNFQREILFVYDNDSEKQISEIYNAPITFKIVPNYKGYTVIGHTLLEKVLGVYSEVQWQLSILSSSPDFHICDGLGSNYCREQFVQPTNKLTFHEVFIPNRNNILGGLQLNVCKYDSISFRAAVPSEINILASLKTCNSAGETEVIGTCKGKGEIYWPCIILEGPHQLFPNLSKKLSYSAANLPKAPSTIKSERSIKSVLKSPKAGSANRTRSTTKIENVKIRKVEECKHYIIEVTAPNGWPLTIAQWSRVEDMRNIQDTKYEPLPKKSTTMKDRGGSAKDKEKRSLSPTMIPQPEDAYTELEVSIAVGGGVTVSRDDTRETAFMQAKRIWELKEVGRNFKGAQIRKDFRNEYLLHIPVALKKIDNASPIDEDDDENEMFKEFYDKTVPTPVSHSSSYIEDNSETREESKFLDIPDQLRDKFQHLEFVPDCTLEEREDKVVLTEDKIEELKENLNKEIENAMKIMNELEVYNAETVFGSQRRRLAFIESLYVDSQLNEDLIEAYNARDATVESNGNDGKTKKK